MLARCARLLPQALQDTFKPFNFNALRTWLVGTENNNVRNFKELRGIQRNVKSLKTNNRACKGILIAPSDFFRHLNSSSSVFRPLP
jgi:hypothetical protein